MNNPPEINTVRNSFVAILASLALPLCAEPAQRLAPATSRTSCSPSTIPLGWVSWGSKDDSGAPVFSVVKEGVDGGDCAQFVFPKTGRQAFGGKVVKSIPAEANALVFQGRCLKADAISCQISLSESRTAVKDGAEWFTTDRTLTPNWMRYEIPLSEFKRRGAIGGPGDKILDRSKMEAVKFNIFNHPDEFGNKSTSWPSEKAKERPRREDRSESFQTSTPIFESCRRPLLLTTRPPTRNSLKATPSQAYLRQTSP
jgi:hypothetical protein